MLGKGKGNFGYNALTDVFEDVVKAGIIDPTKVARTALQNAVSVASLMLTSDALVAPPKNYFARKRKRRCRCRREGKCIKLAAAPVRRKAEPQSSDCGFGAV